MNSRRWLLRNGASAAVVGAAFACTCGSQDEPLDGEFIDSGYPPDEGGYPEEPWGDMPGAPELPGRTPDGGRRGRGGEGKRGKKAPSPSPSPSPSPRPRPAPAPASGIKPVGDDRWEVDRRKVKGWKADPGTIGATAAKKGNGWELTSVRPGSDAEALGARKGDVVTEVNGKSLASTTDLLQVLAMLESQSNFRVRLTRGGQPREHGYRLVSEK